MLPFVLLITLLPLALALRVPSSSDASLTAISSAGAKVDVSTIPNTTPLKRTSTTLPNIQLGASFCVTLSAAVDVNDITLDAGVCLCFDSEVDVLTQNAPCTAVASSGETITGAAAVKLRDSAISALLAPGNLLQHAYDILAGLIFDLTLDLGVCLQVDLFVDHTVHDFTKVGQCCARRCADNYVDDGHGGCKCPTANQCGTQCLSGPALSCNNACYLASEYTCSSNMPKPILNPKRRNAIAYANANGNSNSVGGCGGFGHEMCSVAGSLGYECINTMSDLESCGGCVYTEYGQPQGSDCTSLPQVDQVTCHHGKCLVLSCEKGYKPSRNGTACIDIESKSEAITDIESKSELITALGSGSGSGSELGSILGSSSRMMATIDDSLF